MGVDRGKAGIARLFWITCGLLHGITGCELSRWPNGPHQGATHLSMDRKDREGSDAHFIIYNHNSVNELIHTYPSMNTDSLTQEFTHDPTSFLSTSISTSCRITVPHSTCVQFGHHGRPAPHNQAFLMMLNLHNMSDIRPVDGSSSLDSFCYYGKFNIDKQIGGGANARLEPVSNFCRFRPFRELSTEDEETMDTSSEEDTVYYVSYVTGSHYQRDMAAAFALPIWAESVISVRCGVSPPGGQRAERPSDPTPTDTPGTPSPELIGLVVVVCTVIVAVIVLVPLLVYCFRRRQAEPAKPRVEPIGEENEYEPNSTPFTPGPNAYVDLSKNSIPHTEGNIYTEIPHYKSIGLDQSNGSTDKAPEPPPLRTIPSLKKENNTNNADTELDDIQDTEEQLNYENDGRHYLVLIDDDGLYTIPNKPQTEMVENDVYESDRDAVVLSEIPSGLEEPPKLPEKGAHPHDGVTDNDVHVEAIDDIVLEIVENAVYNKYID